MKIAIHGRNFPESARPYIQSMFEELARRQTEVIISQGYREYLDNAGVAHYSQATYTVEEGVADADFIFSLGGDGTLARCCYACWRPTNSNYWYQHWSPGFSGYSSAGISTAYDRCAFQWTVHHRRAYIW